MSDEHDHRRESRRRRVARALVETASQLVTRGRMAAQREAEAGERRPAAVADAVFMDAQQAAYQQAASKSEEYVKDRSLRLKFLRADCFNVSNAAGRMVRFFEQKLKIFGPDLLAEDITLADLNSDDLAVLNNGHLELVPQRDRSGRQIFCNIRSRERFLNADSLVRSFWVGLLS